MTIKRIIILALAYIIITEPLVAGTTFSKSNLWSYNPLSLVWNFAVRCKQRLFPTSEPVRITVAFAVDTFQTAGANHYQQDYIINNIHGCYGIADGHGEDRELFNNNNLDKESWKKSQNAYKYAVIKELNKNSIGKVSEDASTKVLDLGGTVAHFVAHEFPKVLDQELSKNPSLKALILNFFVKHYSMKKAFKDAARRTDNGLQDCMDLIHEELTPTNDKNEQKAGTTLTVVKPYKGYLWCAHVGDGRVVVFNNKDEIIYASEDHKPNRLDEKRRIENAGGALEEMSNGGFRIGKHAGLAVSRAFGDFHARRVGVTAEPEINCMPLQDVQTVIIGSDGLFDYEQENSTSKPNLRLQAYVKSCRTVGWNQFGAGAAKSLVLRAALWEANVKGKNYSSSEEYLSNMFDNTSAVILRKKSF